jgi:hypothetical protein
MKRTNRPLILVPGTFVCNIINSTILPSFNDFINVCTSQGLLGQSDCFVCGLQPQVAIHGFRHTSVRCELIFPTAFAVSSFPIRPYIRHKGHE